jgi:hypothetical protein
MSNYEEKPPQFLHKVGIFSINNNMRLDLII